MPSRQQTEREKSLERMTLEKRIARYEAKMQKITLRVGSYNVYSDKGYQELLRKRRDAYMQLDVINGIVASKK